MLKRSFALVFLLLFPLFAQNLAEAENLHVFDALNRQLTIPKDIKSIVCSGSGALRLVSYLQAQDMVVAVDDGETRERSIDPRPYAMANPQYKTMPVFGAMSGGDNPELILSLEKVPDLIIKTNTPGRGLDPLELEKKTGIPVLVIEYGDLANNSDKLYQSLAILGEVLGKRDRAQAVISFIKNEIKELKKRTQDVSPQKTAFAGGIAWSGSHGLEATEPTYPPFQFVNIKNIAYSKSLAPSELTHSKISKESILSADPEFIFVDLATTHNGEDSGGIYELKTNPAYQTLSAVQNNKVYGVLPYTWVNNNFDTILADAWFIGSVVYPEKFQGLDISQEADRIYNFLLGKNLYSDLANLYPNQAFQQLDVKK